MPLRRAGKKMQAPLLGLAKSIYYVVKMTKIKIIKVVNCS